MEKNDIIYMDYEVWIKEDDRLYETTKEELAKEHDIYDASFSYAPRAIILGKGQTFPSLEDSLMKAEIDKEYEVEILPEEAFGKRDAELVKLLPISRIIRLGITPDVGKEVEIDGKKGTITFVTASRVRIDFNHPLAGKTLLYRYRVVKKAEKPEEKIVGIIDAYYGKGEDFDIEIGEAIQLKLPDICKYDHRWHEMKYLIISDLREIMEPGKIVFVEEYRGKKKDEKEGKEKEESGEEKGKKGGKKGSGKKKKDKKADEKEKTE